MVFRKWYRILQKLVQIIIKILRNQTYLCKIKTRSFRLWRNDINQLKHKRVSIWPSLMVNWVKYLVKPPHQLDLSEKLDQFVLCQLRVFHHFECDKPPSFLAPGFGNTPVTAFAYVAKNFILFLNGLFKWFFHLENVVYIFLFKRFFIFYVNFR